MRTPPARSAGNSALYLNIPIPRYPALCFWTLHIRGERTTAYQVEDNDQDEDEEQEEEEDEEEEEEEEEEE